MKCVCVVGCCRCAMSADAARAPARALPPAMNLSWVVINQSNVKELWQLVEGFRAMCEEEFVEHELEELETWREQLIDGGRSTPYVQTFLLIVEDFDAEAFLPCAPPDPSLPAFPAIDAPPGVPDAPNLAEARNRCRVLGGAAREYYPSCRCGLISYIVISNALRGQGFAGRVMRRTWDDLSIIATADDETVSPQQSPVPADVNAVQCANVVPPTAAALAAQGTSVHLHHHHKLEMASLGSSCSSSIHSGSGQSSTDMSLCCTPPSHFQFLPPALAGSVPTSPQTLRRTAAPPTGASAGPLNALFIEVLQKRDAIDGKFDAAARQKIWDKMGFVPLDFDLIHPGRLRGGRYQLAVYNPRPRGTTAPPEPRLPSEQGFSVAVLRDFLKGLFTGIFIAEMEVEDDESHAIAPTQHEPTWTSFRHDLHQISARAAAAADKEVDELLDRDPLIAEGTKRFVIMHPSVWR